VLNATATDTAWPGSDFISGLPERSAERVHFVQVMPQGVGWSVHGCGEPLFFRSGRWAEQTARRLAQALARGCAGVELYIHDRSGSLAGRFVFAGLAAAMA
jgi:hypothetical protein